MTQSDKFFLENVCEFVDEHWCQFQSWYRDKFEMAAPSNEEWEAAVQRWIKE